VLEWPGLPSISCALIQISEPDISGPGVHPLLFGADNRQIWGSVVVQAFVSIGIISFVKDPEIIRLLLDSSRLTRFVLALVGTIQLPRSYVSFYHGIVLASLCHLLALPDYLTCLISFPERENLGYAIVDRLLNSLATCLVLAVEVMLIIVSARLEGLDGWCIGPGGLGPPPDIESPIGYSGWGKAVPNYQFLLYYVVLDIVFLISSWWPKRRQGGNWNTQSFSFVQWLWWVGILVQAIVVTTSLVPTVLGLDAKAQRQWTFAQIATVATVIAAIVNAFLKYAFAVVPLQNTASVLRCVQWFQKCMNSQSVN